jgi:Flp pilus assembly protein TadB
VIIGVGLPEPVILVAGVAVIVGCGCAGMAVILGMRPRSGGSRRRTIPLIEHEKDVAAALGWPWRRWIALRLGVAVIGVVIGFTTQIWLLSLLLGAIGFFGVRFLVAGRAARRRLRMERAFLVQLRVLRDRMAIGNQSLDSALQEVGRNPGRDLAHVLEPWGQGGTWF